MIPKDLYSVTHCPTCSKLLSSYSYGKRCNNIANPSIFHYELYFHTTYNKHHTTVVYTENMLNSKYQTNFNSKTNTTRIFKITTTDSLYEEQICTIAGRLDPGPDLTATIENILILS